MVKTVFDDPELFEASVRLTAAYTFLEGYLSGQQIDDKGNESLTWAADLMRRVDWERPDRDKVTPKMAVLATHVRPYFYEGIFESFDEQKKHHRYESIKFTEVLESVSRGGSVLREHVEKTRDMMDYLARRILQEFGPICRV